MALIDQAITLIKQVSPRAAEQLQNNPQIVSQVMQTFQSASQDKNGLISVIKQNGGSSIVQQIENKLNAHPLIRTGITAFLASKNTSFEQLKSEVSNNQQSGQSTVNQSNPYKDRLSRLK